jgi:rhamnulose-1-phosphate aldolase/alcohol dehydrogenase
MEREQGMIVADCWDPAQVAGLSDLDTLIYLSRILGLDPRLVLWGGGNTSLKTLERDYRGRAVPALRIKGSGSDLKAVTSRDFPSVRLDDALALLERDAMTDEEMVEYLRHALLDPASPRPSIETLLHAFVPARCVVHSHADAILILTNSARGDQLLLEVFGDRLAVIPYRLPGFALAKQVAEAARSRPDVDGVILMNHGLITWHDWPERAYRLHVEMVNRAARFIAERAATHEVQVRDALDAAARRTIAARLAPALRGMLSDDGRVIVRFDDSADVLRFVSNPRTPELIREGAATPDHILHVKRMPAWIAPSDLQDNSSLLAAAEEGLATYRRDYIALYEAHARDEPMLSTVPRVVLVAGLGMFGVGKDSRSVEIAGDIYRHIMAIMEGAEVIGGYRSLPASDAFAAEYWPLELYKLTLAPPERQLSRRVALISGAAGAIGAAIARRFAAEGAHVVCADIALESAEALAGELTAAFPRNSALAVRMDVTGEQSVRDAYRRVVLEYGGVDVVVPNAGIALSGPLDELRLEDWQRSLDVNTTGQFLVVAEALRIMKAQGTGGSFVFIATKNVTAPGKDFGAYSASKAAQAQLARVLALEGGAFGIRSNMLNPDAIFAHSGLWTPSVREERARSYGIDPSELEDFYRKRNLLRANVFAEDVAEAALFFASDHSAKTTGAMLPVDGGLREAFPR